MPMMLKLYQRGALLMAAIVLVVIILVMVTAMSFLSVSNIGASGSHMSSAQAFYIANSGLERALYQYSKSDIDCASLTNTNLSISATNPGSFTTSGTVYPTAANSTLSAAITNAATIIPVVSVTGYAPHGRILIESEEIDYSSISNSAAVCSPVANPCFIAYKRAANGTAAAAHGSAVAVYQPSQCLIRSTGTAGSAQRVLEAVVREMSVQTGSVTLPSSGSAQSTTVAINPLNRNRSFVVCSNWTGDEHNGTRITCELTNAASLLITTGATINNTDTVQWYVVEFMSGVAVQRGLNGLAVNISSVNVPISAVNLANTFVIKSERYSTNNQADDEKWTTTAQLTTATNLQLVRNLATTNSVSDAWQVIQHNFAAVQSNVLAIDKSALAASNPVALSPAVNLSKTFAVTTFRAGSSVGGEERRYQTTTDLTNATTLTFTRAFQGAASGVNTQVNISWYAVAMSDATTVQRGAVSSPSGGGFVNVTLPSAIVPTRTLPIISVRGASADGEAGSLGATSILACFATNDACTASSTTNLRLIRENVANKSATVAWFVVQFASQINLVDRVEYFP